MRERLRAKFVRSVQTGAQRLEAAGCYEEAVELYSRGLEADELVEAFYQGLMRSFQRLGRKTDAADTFRRLSRTLAANLGAAPSLESRQLFGQVSPGA